MVEKLFIFEYRQLCFWEYFFSKYFLLVDSPSSVYAVQYQKQGVVYTCIVDIGVEGEIEIGIHILCVLEELFRKIYKPTISLYLHSLSLYKSNVEQKILLYYLLSVLRNISYISIAMIVFIFSYIYLLLLCLCKIHRVLMVSTIQKNLQNYRNIDQVIQYNLYCVKLEVRAQKSNDVNCATPFTYLTCCRPLLISQS